MVLASGVNFGYARTVPHILGITGGFAVMVVAVRLGLGTLLRTYPALDIALKIAGGAYLLWPGELPQRVRSPRAVTARPLTFLQAAAFQWVDPKAWVLVLTATAVYAVPEAPVISVGGVIATFTVIMLPSLSLWTAFGRSLRYWLSQPSRLKWFNITMGVLLAATLWPMLR